MTVYSRPLDCHIWNEQAMQKTAKRNRSSSCSSLFLGGGGVRPSLLGTSATN
jgi:hypothetical protein